MDVPGGEQSIDKERQIGQLRLGGIGNEYGQSLPQGVIILAGTLPLLLRNGELALPFYQRVPERSCS